MSSSPQSHRRDFLSGQAARDRLAAAAQGALDAHGEADSQETYLVRVGRRAMACEFEVLLNAGQYPHGTAVALAALDLVEQLEDQLTVYRETSEVMAINHAAAAGPVAVEPKLFALLQQAVELWRETGGAFDLTSGPLSKVWGFYRRQGELPDEAALAVARASVGSDKLELDSANSTVRFRSPGMELNLGAIGKGFALDRCAELLAGQGIEHCLLHGGQSSVLARGAHGATTADYGWIVSIHDPMRPGRVLAELRLHDCSVGTSGAGAQFFRHAGRRYGHILDPRSGWPAEGVLSATVVAPTAAMADALSTAFYILGPDGAEEYCGRHPEVAALLTIGSPDSDSVEVRATGFAVGDLKLAE